MARRRPVGRSRYSVIVIGLGVFGTAVAETLMEMGHEVLGVDEDPDVVAELAPRLTTAVEADGTSEVALRQLGAADFSRGLVAVGDLEASVLAASHLIDIGVEQVWAKALSQRHARILERLGVAHVVLPEREQGRRVGHLMGGSMLDFIEVEDGWALVKVVPLPESVGVTLRESNLRERYGITVVGTKQPDQTFRFAHPEMVIHADDTVIIAGPTAACEQFSSIAHAAQVGRGS